MSQACAERQCPVRGRADDLAGQSGQAALMMLAIVATVLAGAVLLFAFGNALGANGRYQRAADLATISAAQVMRELYPRLFEPPFIEPGVPNPRHLDEADYRELAVTAAVRRASKRCRSSTPPVASSMEVSAGSDAGATDPAAILGSTSVAAADSGA
jgi:hypothetical protein